MKTLFLKIFFIICAVGLAAIFANAQNATETPLAPEVPSLAEQAEDQLKILQEMLPAMGKSFEVEFYPEYPGANTRVSAQVISYSFDVNRSEIAWIIAGKIVGTGKTFSFTTAGLGSELTLRVSVITDDEVPLSKTFTFRASEVDLLWETPGYSPAQYPGKVLTAPRSLIKVIAVPWGMKTSDSRLIYEWKRDAKNLPDVSGPGKKTLAFYADEAGEELIEVKVSSPDKRAAAFNRIRININEPKIIFYEEHPLEGPQYQKALAPDFTLEKPELILRAEPYFFSKRALPVLTYEWRMNDKKVENQPKPNILNLAAPSGAKGVSLIKLSLMNPQNILEMAEKALQINFNP